MTFHHHKIRLSASLSMDWSLNLPAFNKVSAVLQRKFLQLVLPLFGLPSQAVDKNKRRWGCSGAISIADNLTSEAALWASNLSKHGLHDDTGRGRYP